MNIDNGSVFTKQELSDLVASVISSSIQSQDIHRAQIVKQTSLMHLMNVSDKGKAFLIAGVDLTLAVIDASFALPVAFFKSEIVKPSLTHNSLIELLRGEKRHGIN